MHRSRNTESFVAQDLINFPRNQFRCGILHFSPGTINGGKTREKGSVASC
mgnify:CR=1 FL=1